jgi:hypothetical protein
MSSGDHEAEDQRCRELHSKKNIRIILVGMQRGSVGSALACCKAGPSSNLSSASHTEVPPTEPKALKKWRWASTNI